MRVNPTSFSLGRKKWIFLVPLLLLFLSVGLSQWEIVDATEACTKLRYGNVVEPRVEAGFEWMPLHTLECFPDVQMQYPSLARGSDQAPSFAFSVVSRDSVTLEGELSFEWEYTDQFAAFTDKRNHMTVLSAINGATETAIKDAGATIGLDDLFGARREGLDQVFRSALQKRVPSYVVIGRVYLRKLEPPAQVKSAWQGAVVQRAEQQKARDGYVADSLRARSRILEAEVVARTTELNNRARASTPIVLDVERAKAFSELLSKCTQNCYVGGDVMQRYFTIPR